MKNDTKITLLTSLLNHNAKVALSDTEKAAILALVKELFVTYGAPKLRTLIENMCGKLGLDDDQTAKVLEYYDEIISNITD